MKFPKTIFIGITLSILIFGFCTILSYLLSKDGNRNYELGWPFNFYYQFALNKGEEFEIQHGSWPMNLTYDCILSFVFAILIFFVYKKIKGNNLKLYT